MNLIVKILSFIFIVNTFACTQDKIVDEEKITKTNSEALLELPIQIIVNDSLIIDLISKLEKIYCLEVNYSETLKPVKNLHNKLVVDTFKSLQINSSIIDLYKTPTHEFAISAIIKDSEIVLDQSIRVGISKSIFARKIDIDILSNKVRITNTENTSVFNFRFQNERLKSIDFENYFD